MGLETPYVPWGCHPELIAAARAASSAAPTGSCATSSPAASSATASRSSRCWRRSRRPPTSACGWSSRPRSSASRCAPPRRPRRARLADRAAARRPADGRAPARARRLRRLPRAGALGGARAAALRGDRVRAAGDHQRRAADERGDPRRRATGSWSARTPNGTAKSGIPALDPDVGDLRRAIERLADDALRAELAAGAIARPRQRAAWAATVAGIGELLATAANRVAWRASWGFSDQIDRYRKRAGHRPRRPAPARAQPEPPPAPFVCGVTRSGTTLLRLMLDSHPDVAIPGETHWVPKLIKAFERSKQTGEDAADLAIDHKRWGDFHLDADELRDADHRACTRSRRPTRSAPSTCSTPSARARPATATRRPATCRRCAGSSACCPRRASSTSSATAATSRSRTCG